MIWLLEDLNKYQWRLMLTFNVCWLLKQKYFRKRSTRTWNLRNFARILSNLPQSPAVMQAVPLSLSDSQAYLHFDFEGICMLTLYAFYICFSTLLTHFISCVTSCMPCYMPLCILFVFPSLTLTTWRLASFFVEKNRNLNFVRKSQFAAWRTQLLNNMLHVQNISWITSQ